MCTHAAHTAWQDSLADWAVALLFDKACTAGSKPRGRAGKRAATSTTQEGMDWEGAGAGAAGDEGTATAAAAAAAQLRVLLAAVADVGRAAGACLAKLCAALAAKKRLRGANICRGLEAIVSGASRAI